LRRRQEFPKILIHFVQNCTELLSGDVKPKHVAAVKVNLSFTHIIKAQRGVEINLHSFLNSTLDGGDLPNLCTGRFNIELLPPPPTVSIEWAPGPISTRDTSHDPTGLRIPFRPAVSAVSIILINSCFGFSLVTMLTISLRPLLSGKP